MNIIKRHHKKKLCEQHREQVYSYVLDELIQGKTTPSHVYYRYKKVLEARGK